MNERKVIEMYANWESSLNEQADITAATLLEMLHATITKYFVLTEAQKVVVAVWILHTYVFLAARLIPYLRIFSATKRCGKSNLIDFLELHVAKP